MSCDQDVDNFNDQNVLLFEATKRGDITHIQRLLMAGASLRTRDEKGNTPLYLAVRDNNAAVVRVLAEAIGANNPGIIYAKNDDGDSPLHSAAARGNIELASLLIKYGAKDDDVLNDGADEDTPLMQAARNRHVDMVQFLLENGAKRDIDGALDSAVAGGCFKVVEVLLACGARISDCKDYGRSLLVDATRSGNIDMMNWLLRTNGVHAQDVGSAAARSGNIDSMAYLLRRGVQVNALDTFFGITLCHAAAKVCDADMLSFLHANGADINARRDPYFPSTPFELALTAHWIDREFICPPVLTHPCVFKDVSNDGGDESRVAISLQNCSCLDAVERLADLGADMHCFDNVDVLCRVFEVGNCNMIELLFRLGVNLQGSGGDVVASLLNHYWANTNHEAIDDVRRSRFMRRFKNAIELYVAYFAPLSAEAMPAALNAASGDEEFIAMLHDSQCKSHYSAAIRAGIERAEQRLLQLRIAMFRDRATDICIGLQNLRLPALVTMMIVQAALRVAATRASVNAVYRIAMAVKHKKK